MPDLQSGETSGTGTTINDCWNKIGVGGDASCPILQQHAHCRNCPVYSAMAVTLLDRELPTEHLTDWTDHFAQGRPAEESDTHSAMIFRIGAEWFAFPTLLFDEVAELRTVHSLPHRRNSVVLGLVNVRGELIICVSLGRMLGLVDTTSPKPDRSGSMDGRLVVIRHEGGRTAFPVDEIQTIHRYHSRELKGVPATIVKAAATYTRALLPWRGKLVGCLDASSSFTR
jgi:chemotaxis-related protein WspD